MTKEQITKQANANMVYYCVTFCVLLFVSFFTIPGAFLGAVIIASIKVGWDLVKPFYLKVEESRLRSKYEGDLTPSDCVAGSISTRKP